MIDQGYAVHPSVFDHAQMRALAASIETTELPRSRAGARHVLGCEPIARLAHDELLLDIASLWLGARAVPFKATLFDKSPEANWLAAWHQDTALPMESRREVAGWGPWSEKYGVTYAHAPARVLAKIIALRVHLDDSTADNGPLRVIPGTHGYGVLTDAQVHEFSARVPSVECLLPAGGVIAMRPLIVHASSKVRTNASRRVLHFEYAGALEPEPGLRLRAA